MRDIQTGTHVSPLTAGETVAQNDKSGFYVINFLNKNLIITKNNILII